MDKNSPYHTWDPTSFGWLERCFASGTHVSREDVRRVLNANPELESDSKVRRWIRDSLQRQPRMPVGRPKRSFHQEALLVMAGMMAQEQIAEWREQRAKADPSVPSKGRGQPSLADAAYEKMARAFRLGSGRGLANAASQLKEWPYFGD